MHLTTVTRTQGNNAALKDGTVAPDGFTLDFEELWGGADVEHSGFVEPRPVEVDGIKVRPWFTPGFADALYELGRALLQQGDSAGAIENLEAAAKLIPGEARVHEQLGRAYLAAGRKAEAESQLKVSEQLKGKARSRTN